MCADCRSTSLEEQANPAHPMSVGNPVITRTPLNYTTSGQLHGSTGHGYWPVTHVTHPDLLTHLTHDPLTHCHFCCIPSRCTKVWSCWSACCWLDSMDISLSTSFCSLLICLRSYASSHWLSSVVDWLSTLWEDRTSRISSSNQPVVMVICKLSNNYYWYQTRKLSASETSYNAWRLSVDRHQA